MDLCEPQVNFPEKESPPITPLYIKAFSRSGACISPTMRLVNAPHQTPTATSLETIDLTALAMSQSWGQSFFWGAHH